MNRRYSITLLFVITFFLIQSADSQNLFKNNISYSLEPLPVELIYFDADVLTNSVLLRWGTATELNNYGFVIERSHDLLIFNNLGFVPGHGTSYSPKHYTFEDSTLPSSGKYYYRLKQIDNDGATKYSDTLSVNYISVNMKNEVAELQDFIIYQNFPNPFNTKTNIRFSIPKSGEVTMNIYDVLGNLILVPFSQYLGTGTYDYSFDAVHLASGNYLLSIRQNNSEKRIKITLLK